MRNLTLTVSHPLYKAESSATEIQNRQNHLTTILICFSGGLISLILAFLLLAAFTFFERSNQTLNYTGSGLLIVAFIFFSLSAHWMDKSERSKSEI